MFQFGGAWSFFGGGLSPPKPPHGDGTGANDHQRKYRIMITKGCICAQHSTNRRERDDYYVIHGHSISRWT